MPAVWVESIKLSCLTDLPLEGADLETECEAGVRQQATLRA